MNTIGSTVASNTLPRPPYSPPAVESLTGTFAALVYATPLKSPVTVTLYSVPVAASLNLNATSSSDALMLMFMA